MTYRWQSRLLLFGLLIALVCPMSAVTFSHLAVVATTSSSATISVTTSGSVSVQINYGVGNTVNTVGPDSPGTSHTFTISGLSTGFTYTYLALASDSTSTSTQQFRLCDATVNTVPLQGKVNSYYLYGTFSAVWTDSASTGLTPTLCGASITQTVTGSLDYLGSFSATLPDNLKVVPSPSVWAVTVEDVGDVGPVTVNATVTAPTTDISAALQTGALNQLQYVWYNPTTKAFYPPIAGSGTVTSFSAGNLSPLFTTSVTSPSSTPALSFTLSNFAADSIFGNFTGGSAQPSTQAIPSCANDGSHALTYPSHTLTCTAISGGGGGSPGGSNTQMQFNDSSSFGGDPDFLYTKSTHTHSTTSSGVFDFHLASSFLLPGSLSTGLVRVTTSTGALGSAEMSGFGTTSGNNALVPGVVASGQTLTIQSGGTLTCAAGSTCLDSLYPAGPYGGILLYHNNSTIPTVYAASANTDVARGTAELTAGTASADGDTMVLACGFTYNTGSTPPFQWVKNSTGRSIIVSPGCAPLSTVVTYSHGGQNDADVGLDLCGSTNFSAQGFYLTDTATGVYTYVVGASGGSGTCAVTNFTLQGMAFNGDSDDFFLDAQSITGLIDHSSFTSLWDNITPGACSGHLIIQNSTFEATGNSTVTGAAGQARNVKSSGVGLSCISNSTLIVDVINSTGDATSPTSTASDNLINFLVAGHATLNVRGGVYTAECTGTCTTTPEFANTNSGNGNFHVTGPYSASPTTITGSNQNSSNQFSAVNDISAQPITPSSVVTTSDITDGNLKSATAVATDSNGKLIQATAIPSSDITAVTLPAAGSSGTFSGPSYIFVCSTTCTITVPVPAAGLQYCAMNGDNVSTVITLSAIGSSARYENQARTAYGTAGTGTLVSGGAVKDSVCILGLDSTHYLFASGNGTWTAN